MAKVPVYEDEKIIARVEYNTNLDFWDGRNYTCGQTGRHLGCTKLKSGKYVLIHGTQWQGERDHAEVVTAAELIQAAARTHSIDDLYEKYPELREVGLSDDEAEQIEPETLEAEIVPFGNGAHVVLPKDQIGKRIRYTITD